MRVQTAVVGIVLLVAAATSVRVGATPEALTVTASVSSNALPPGGVVIAVVHGSEAMRAVEGYAFGRPVRFWTDADPTTWFGLVPAGLDARPGPYTVTISGTGPAGTGSSSISVRVEPKRFETRRLKVDPQFVNPPTSEGERIAREARQMAALFAQISPDRLWRGPFEMPVPGQPTSSFGRLTVLNGESRGRHQGADFRAATGTPVHAPNAGRVVLAADLYFSGNTVIIDHGLGMFSLFAHFSHLGVHTGEMVSRGQVLGESGATGRVTGPHLHWALRLGEASVDPLAVVEAVAALGE